MTETIQVVQMDYDYESSAVINMEFVGNDLVIYLADGAGVVIINEYQIPTLCGMLYRKVAGECNK